MCMPFSYSHMSHCYNREPINLSLWHKVLKALVMASAIWGQTARKCAECGREKPHLFKKRGAIGQQCLSSLHFTCNGQKNESTDTVATHVAVLPSRMHKCTDSVQDGRDKERGRTHRDRHAEPTGRHIDRDCILNRLMDAFIQSISRPHD